jgi:hypothetical protein
MVSHWTDNNPNGRPGTDIFNCGLSSEEKRAVCPDGGFCADCSHSVHKGVVPSNEPSKQKSFLGWLFG